MKNHRSDTTELRSPDLQSGNALSEINNENAIREYVAPNKNIVWRVQGGQTCYISLDIQAWQGEAHSEDGDENWFAPGLPNFSLADWAEIEFSR